MLNSIAINSNYPVIGRYPQRTVVATLNATIINLVNQDIRAKRQTMTEAPGVEVPTEEEALLEQQHEDQQRSEQGFTIALKPLELAAMLKLIRDSLADDLLKHAGILPSLDGKTRVYNPFDLALNIENTLDFRIKQEPAPYSEAVVNAYIKALGVTRDEVLIAQAAQHKTEVTFLKNNREDILQTIEGLDCGYTLDEAEIVFDKLPPIHQLRLYAAAMRGVGKGRQNELNGFIRRRPDAAGNMAMLDSLLRDLFYKLDRLMELPTTKNALEEASERGLSIPTFPPRPAPVQTEAVEVARKTHVVHKDGTREPAVA